MFCIQCVREDLRFALKVTLGRLRKRFDTPARRAARLAHWKKRFAAEGERMRARLRASGQPLPSTDDLNAALAAAKKEYRASLRSGLCPHGKPTRKAQQRAARYRLTSGG